MNLLITGGAGYVGTVLTDYILCNYESVNIRVIDNLMYKQDGVIPFCSVKYGKRYEFVYGDVRDSELIQKHIDWADTVIPLAALVGFPACERDRLYAQQVNTDAVIEVIKHIKNKKLLLPQTNSGYGTGEGLHCTEETPLRPITTYGRTKCAAETAVLDAGGIVFRLATAFGVSPRMRLDLLVNDFTYKAVTDGYVVLFEKDFKRNYIHVRDIASAFCFMIDSYEKNQGQVFNVGLSDANLSKWELCHKIKQYVPDFSIQVDEIRSDPDKRNYIVSNDKIEKTGWKPKVSLDDGIQELIHAYRIISNVSRKYANI